jgi:hypothetical protein
MKMMMDPNQNSDLLDTIRVNIFIQVKHMDLENLYTYAFLKKPSFSLHLPQGSTTSVVQTGIRVIALGGDY